MYNNIALMVVLLIERERERERDKEIERGRGREKGGTEREREREIMGSTRATYCLRSNNMTLCIQVYKFCVLQMPVVQCTVYMYLLCKHLGFHVSYNSTTIQLDNGHYSTMSNISVHPPTTYTSYKISLYR